MFAGFQQSLIQCFALVLLVCGAVLLTLEAQQPQKENVETKFWEGIVPLLIASVLSGGFICHVVYKVLILSSCRVMSFASHA